jgi:hypothetical protein
VQFFIGAKMENIELETVRGDDDGWTFEILEDDEQKSDLTGSKFDMWIEPKKGEIIKLSTETGEITVNENLVTVTLSHDKTLGAKWETASWDLQCTSTQGLIRTLAGGKFTLIHDITEAR